MSIPSHYDPRMTVLFIRSLDDEQLLERIYQSAQTMHMMVHIGLDELAAFVGGIRPKQIEHCEVEVIQPEIVLIEGS